MEYQVTIKETLSRLLRIDSSSAKEAVDRVWELYRKEKVVLDYSDLTYCDVFTDVSEEKITPYYRSASHDFTLLHGDTFELLPQFNFHFEFTIDK